MKTSNAHPEEPWTGQKLRLIAGGGRVGEKALSDLYLAYRPRILRHLLSSHLSAETAEDILHITFLKIAERAGQWKGTGSASAWLWVIVRNARMDHYQSLRREEFQDEAAWEALLEQTAAPVSDDQSGLLQKCVQSGLQQFERDHPDRSDAIRLMHIEEWSVAQLSEYLKRTAGATREYLSQCRRVLKPYLQPCLAFLAQEE